MTNEPRDIQRKLRVLQHAKKIGKATHQAIPISDIPSMRAASIGFLEIRAKACLKRNFLNAVATKGMNRAVSELSSLNSARQ